MNKSFLASLVFIFLGCTSLGPKFSQAQKPAKDKALIYVYRVNKFAGSAGSPYVCMGKQVIGEIPNGGYFMFTAPPGSHELRMRGVLGDTLASFPFNVKAQQVYYVRTDFSLNSGAKEGAEAARQGALGPGGGGAIGAAMSAGFFGGKEEAEKILSHLDKRVQEQSNNPGFLFVKPDFAETEIKQTEVFTVPAYKNNPCK